VIAVVDDTERTRLALRRTLERNGYAVVEGACGADALRLARENPALMVLDGHMPDLVAPQLVRQLRLDPVTRSIPILQVSARFSEDSDRTSGGMADAYLIEPVDPELLLATVRALLRGRSAERLAERALQMRDEFLSVVSHDIRGLLQALRLTLDVQLVRAENGTLDPDVMVRAIRRSIGDVQQMTMLVEDLLDRAQLEAGKLILHPVQADLVDVVAKAVERSASAAPTAGSPIELDAPAPVIATFDRVRIDQVVSNLISNAMKYGGEKPVRVRVRKEGNAARISVTDCGPGIPADRQEQVFEPFERGEGTPARIGSYGLGLFIARRLVQLHGGEILVESNPDTGTTFTVVLPLAA
jgi:signal transduction histidine kinase